MLKWLHQVLRKHAPAPRARKRNHLPIPIVRQKTQSDCGAAVLRMVFGFYTDRILPQTRALRLTKWTPDGVHLREIPRAMKLLTGSESKRLTTLAAARTALKQGVPVISNDAVSYADDHAVLLCGATPRGIYVADPNTGEIRLRSLEWMKRASDEFIAIFPPPPALRPVRTIKNRSLRKS